MAGPLGTPKGGLKGKSGGTSAPQNTAVGSSSRPGGGKFPIDSSAPKNAETMDRDTSGSRK